MSTSLLYHAWGIRGYRHVRTQYQQGGLCFGIEQTPETFRCSNCGSSEVVKSGQVVRRFHALPVGSHAVSIELPVQRLWCSNCGKTRQAKVAFARERHSDTHAFERYALELCRHMTILDVAHHLGRFDSTCRGRSTSLTASMSSNSSTKSRAFSAGNCTARPRTRSRKKCSRARDGCC